MNAHTQDHRDFGFVIGLLTGTFVGAGLTMLFAPRFASEVRQRMTDLGQRASEQYQQAGTRVGEAVDELTRKGQGFRDDVAEAVARGAHEVERYATAARSDRVPEARTPSAADRSASKPQSP